jgi:PLP dependent protein
MGAIAAGLQACRARIATACHEAHRPADSVTLLAVSKTFSAEVVREAWRAGQRIFGESYLQEALPKLLTLADLDLEWHFIGPIQGNKTRPIAEHFHWAHGIDRVRIAQRLSEARPAALPPLQVCIQVNVSGETGKHGVPPQAVLDLARQVATLPGLNLRGFMCIPRETPDQDEQRTQFRVLHDLLEASKAGGLVMDTLSMGMSMDLEAAILEGATLVRVGSAVFGHRRNNAMASTLSEETTS